MPPEMAAFFYCLFSAFYLPFVLSQKWDNVINKNERGDTMNAFNSYGYNMSNMPNRLDTFAQPYAQPYAMPFGVQPNAPRREQLLGYIVNSIDDAKAARIDFDGSTTYFPCPSANEIYAKTIDLDGRAVMKVYKLQQAEQTQFADCGTVARLTSRIEKLESILKELGCNDESVSNDANSTK